MNMEFLFKIVCMLLYIPKVYVLTSKEIQKKGSIMGYINIYLTVKMFLL